MKVEFEDISYVNHMLLLREETVKLFENSVFKIRSDQLIQLL